MRWQAAAFGLVVLGTLIGCGSSGSELYRVSGRVTFKGEPIAFGVVVFTPDGAKKNTGAQGIAPIRNGQFDTRTAGGKGFGGGAVVVSVAGNSNAEREPLCGYEFRIDLPHGDATYDFDVPPEGVFIPGPDF